MSTGEDEPVFRYRHGSEEVALYDTPLCGVDLGIAAGVVSPSVLEEIESEAQPVKAGIVLVPIDAIDGAVYERLDEEGAILPVLSQKQRGDDTVVIARPEARVTVEPGREPDDIAAALDRVGLDVRSDKRHLVASPATGRARDMLGGIQQLADSDTGSIEVHPRFLRLVPRPDVH